MSTTQERYFELLAFTKLYIQQEHAPTDRILSESETYTYFRNYALQNQNKNKAKSQGHAQAHTQPPVPSPIQPKPTTPSQTQLKPQSAAQTPQNAAHHKPSPNTPQNINHLENISGSQLSDRTTEPQMSVKVIARATDTQRSSPAEKTTEFQENSTKQLFSLEIPAAPKPLDFTVLRKIIHEKLPHMHLIEQAPDDAEAKRLAKIWDQEKQISKVIILSFDETPKHQAFLANIRIALEVIGISAQVTNAIKFERDNAWENLLQSKELKLVVASSSGFYNLPELQKKYREGTKQGRHFLGDRALLLLSDISFYLKEPALKPSLWSALKELMASTAAIP